MKENPEFTSTIEENIDYDLDTMDGALDKYGLTYDFIASNMKHDFKKSSGMGHAERRKRYDMILKVRGGYKPEKAKIDTEVTYKWEDEETD